MPFYAFHFDVRRILYTTNAIEALNAKLRRAVRAGGYHPTYDAAMKLLFLILNRSEKEWKIGSCEWVMVKAQFAAMFGERLTRQWQHMFNSPPKQEIPDSPRTGHMPKHFYFAAAVFFAMITIAQIPMRGRANEVMHGSQIVFVVNQPSLIEGVLSAFRDHIRINLRDAKIGYKDLFFQGRTVEVRIRQSTKIDKAKVVLADMIKPLPGGATEKVMVAELALQESEGGLLRYRLTDEGLNHRLANAVMQSTEVLSRRLDELLSGDSRRSLPGLLWAMAFGTTEATIERQGECIFVKIPKGLIDPRRLESILRKPARLTFQLVDLTMSASDAINGRPPAGSTVAYTISDPPQPYLVENRIIVSNENLVDAQASFDGRTNEPVVSFRLDAKGAALFGQATLKNIGRPIAILLDNRAISVPQIREPIYSGIGQISGNFTNETATELAILLRAGPLPFDLDVLNVIPTRAFCTVSLPDN